MSGRKDRRRTSSDIEVKPVYQPKDLAGFDPAAELGNPGAFPFTRGVHPGMYRTRPWTMRQYAGFGDAADTNRRFRFLLGEGQTGLSVAFDLPTQMGYDSDAVMARGEVGKVGVAIDTLADMEALLDGIPLDRVSTSMTINATAGILLCMYMAVGEKQGVPATALSGTIQNDILKEYIARGTYIYPPGPSLRLTTDIFEFATREVPNWNTISISGYHIREAGSTAAQELAYTLLDGLTYVEAAVARGLDIDSFAPRLSFFFNAHSNFFEEIAKFRAARRLWARLMSERFSPANPDSLKLRFHTQTAGSTLTAQQPMNNIVRTTLEALSAILGGTQSLHTNSMDEAIGLPTAEAALLALRTQQIVAEETGIADTVDPLAGSWFIESLTTELESAARALIRDIEERGGMLRAIETGYVQEEIHRTAWRTQKAIEAGEQVIVGVNRFQMEEPEPRPFRHDPTLESAQVSRLAAIRARRDTERATAALLDVESAARGTANLMPPILEAVRAYAGVGEISDALRRVFGTHN
ncbi:MAG: methylmalonyl-CoA mutase family protein [Candidatus Eisenbacteria bacterium]|nr:methylmalonyl-CoA mutase family protein [Candidatus Eisenbacteria bacterium]